MLFRSLRRITLCAAVSAALLLLSVPSAWALGVRAGEHFPFAAESPHPYPSGGGAEPAWSVVVEHPGASFIAIHFDRFHVAHGDHVVVRSESGDQRYVFKDKGRSNLGAFWAHHVKGDRAIVELFTPSGRRGAPGVSIDRYSAGDPEAGLLYTAAPEAVCGADDRENAVCFQSSEPGIYNRARAVARMAFHGDGFTFFCTAWLVGCQGHLMTNNHCIDDDALPDPATVVMNADFEFMLEAGGCGFPGSTSAIWPGAASLVQRDPDPGMDYAFILLTGNPQNTYGALQLENRAPIANERIYIPQHPGGLPKQIAVTSDAFEDESGFCEVQTPVSAIKCTGGGPGDTTYFCDSRPGSSGSPVLAYASQAVVALHHCSIGVGVCPNLGVPINAIIADLGGNLPGCAIVNAVADLQFDDAQADDGLFGNGNGVIDPFEIPAILVDLRNDGNLLTTTISATLSTTTTGVTVLDDAATWPDIAGFGLRTSDAPHFEVQIADTVPCGTFIDFDLAIGSDQGVFNRAFQLIVGQNTLASASEAATDTPKAIPDNDPLGVTSTLFVPDSFVIGDIQVSVDISHTRIGDLEVDLMSPGGTTVRLHDRTGGAADDIDTTYDGSTTPDGPGTMNDFDSEGTNGLWQLKVFDQQNQQTGVLNGWSLDFEEILNPSCSPVPCEVTVDAVGVPGMACEGDNLLLDASASTEFGQDCVSLEYQFKQGPTILQDWSSDPDLVIPATIGASYSARARDSSTLAQDAVIVPVTVTAPSTSVVQLPEPMCVETAAGDLDAGAGFSSYTWTDDTEAVVGTSQTLAVNAAACGRTYTVEITDGIGCSATFEHVVLCISCAPDEVSPPGDLVPFQWISFDGSQDTFEFELLPDPGLDYHLYHADSIANMLAGNWTVKFCDLENNTGGIWTPIDGITVRWTAVTGFPGHWVIIAEDPALGLEGSYGAQSDGTPRAKDADQMGSLLNLGCD